MKLLSLDRSALLSNRPMLAFCVSLLFHTTGLLGIVFGNSPFIRDMTPIHLVLVSVLVFISADQFSKSLVGFFLVASFLGFTAELIGIHTGLLFGNYAYGTVLGPKIADVPVLIGINWAIILLGSGHLVGELCERAGLSEPGKMFAIIFGGAFVATLFDWVMEPVAVKLGYWSWSGSVIPALNYISWFAVSALGLGMYALIRPAGNMFFSLLLLTQLTFFTLLRILL